MSNQLFYGDNLEVLRKHIRDETVDLCYIDPPFNSKRNYNQIYNNVGKEDQAQAQAFIDTWTWDDYANQGLIEIQENYQGRFTTQSIDLISGLTKVLGKGALLAYLISMTLRIVEIHRVLKPTGSFYLHCDPTASHYLKIVLDAIFCAQGGIFRNEVIWHYKRWPARQTNFQRMHDVILLFSKDKDKNTFNTLYEELSEGTQKRWKGKKSKVEFEGDVRLVTQMTEEDSIGRPADDVWNIPVINSQARERLGYPTQKPESLLERIIQVSSNEGDVILDAYCGCGTSVAVSQRLDRKWIGIDITYQSISLILKRLEDAFGKGAIDNIILNGIPKDMESAKALALKQDDRTRKEFEKWAVLTYSNNRAVINQKKGADKGIDGIAYIRKNADDLEKVILQVKSGNVKSGDIRDLLGTITTENAAIGILITLKAPSKDMIKAAKEAGIHKNMYRNEPIDKIQIVTIQEIVEEQKRINLPLMEEVLKSAEKQKLVRQAELDFS